MKRYIFLSLWLLATAALGAGQYTIKRMERMNLLPSPTVRCILHDSEGFMWYGTDKGACRDNGYQIDVFRPDNRPCDVTVLAEDSTHNILTGTATGLYRLSKTDYTMTRIATAGSGSIRAVCVSSDGHIWVATGNNITELSGDFKTIKAYASRHNGRPCSVTFLYEDSNNRMWGLQDNGGITIKDGDKGSFTEHSFIDGCAPVAVVEDRQNYCFWVATKGRGIVRYVPSEDPKKPWCIVQTATFSPMEPLRSCCNSVYTDNTGKNIVVAADDNIYQYQIVKSSDSADSPTLTSPKKLLPNTTFSCRLLYRDRNGTLWTADRKTGMARLTDSQERTSTRATVTTAVIDTIVHYFGLGQKELNVPAGCDFLELRFSTLDFHAPGITKYQYCIPELGHRWTTLQTGDNKAYVVNLPEGRYSVKVRTADRDGNWSEGYTVLTINRLPAWWNTWWMKTVYIAALVSIIILALCLFVRRRQTQNRNVLEYNPITENDKTTEKQNQDNKPVSQKKAACFALSDHDRKFLADAESYVEKHIGDETYSVNQLSRDLRMSRMNMYRKVTVLTGMKPTEFIRNIRLRHAAHMLEDPRNNVSDVAYACGFSSPNYFSRCFKEIYGMTPTEYAEQ